MNLYAPDSLIAGRYEVASRPLVGGMGIVYLCYDHVENRPVALKTFKPEYLPDRAARDRFLREGDTWIKLERHPHIVHAYNVERVGDGTEVYLVLELIAKEQGRQDASLRSWLTPGRPLPPEQAMLFAMQVIRGMQHATERISGFSHRDLKPENLLVGSDKLTNADINRLRVTDFGLASVLGEVRAMGNIDEQNTASYGRTQLTRGIVGTPLYMAPEQWRGEGVSAATDIYALGCIVLEMLAGEHAVSGSSLVALEQAHKASKSKALPANMPAELRGWMEQCLRLAPSDRFASWGETEAGLEAAYEALTGRQLPKAEGADAMGQADRVAAGWAQSALGASYLDIGKAEVAVKYFEGAAEIGKREEEKVLEGAALGNLGNAYNSLGDLKNTIRYIEQALMLSRESGDRSGEGKALGNLGNAYRELGDTRRAIGFYEQQLTISRETNDRRGEGNALGGLGISYKNLGDSRRAIGFYEQELRIARDIGDRRGEGYALGNMGVAYVMLENTQRAIELYEQALAVAREIGDRETESICVGNLGNAYNMQRDTRRAIGFYQEQLTITHEIGYRRGEGYALGNLGNAYLKLGDARRAMEYYEQALHIRREIGDLSGEATDLLNVARLYSQQGNTAQALALAQEALGLFRQMGHPYAQNAERLIKALEGHSPAGEIDEARIRQQLGPLIVAVVAAANGNQQARVALEQAFPQLQQGGFRIVEPINQIWQGERDESKLTRGLHEMDAFIVREILARLK